MSKRPDDLERDLEVGALEKSGGFTLVQGEHLRNQIDTISNVFGEFRAAAEALENTGRYSPGGLSDIVEQGRIKAFADLATIEKTTVAVLDGRIAAEAAQLAGISAGTADYNIERETRDVLMKMDSITREYTYLECCKDGDDPVLERAVENAPRLLKMVSADALAQGRDARIKRVSPVKWAELDHLRQWRDTVRGYLKRTKTQITKYRRHGVL